ncbi:hypothetical protein ACFX2A_022456 [Malus domestica]
MMVGTRLLKLFKVGIVEENWKEDLRETTGSYPVSEARATVQGRVVASLWGFAAGGAMGFTGDEMVLNEEKCEECLSGSMGVAGNRCTDKFPAAAHALAMTELEQDQRG